MQAALAEGMTVLIGIEARIKAESGIANHEGIGLEAVHDTYMSYARGETSIETAALVMAENIKTVVQTQTLTVSENVQLTGVLAEIVGDAELTEAYIGTAIVGVTGAVTGRNIDSAINAGDNGGGSPSNRTPAELLKRSTCTKNDLYQYLQKKDKGAADEYLRTGSWPEGEQIPKGPDVLKPDGTINWDEAREGGYVLDENGNVIKIPYTPFVEEIIDRYGSPDGRYASPIKDGEPSTYDQRSLPYVEDPSQYHQYRVIGDFENIMYYINNCRDSAIKGLIEDYIKAYNITEDQLIVYRGEIAPAFNSTGGGIQYQLPLPIDLLIAIRLLEKIF